MGGQVISPTEPAWALEHGKSSGRRRGWQATRSVMGTQQLRIASGSPRPRPAPALVGGGAPWPGSGSRRLAGRGRLRYRGRGRRPGASAGRGTAKAEWGGSEPAASSCSPPAWGSARRSEVRAPNFPSPSQPRPGARGARQERGVASGTGAGRPLYSGGFGRRRGPASPSATASLTLWPGLGSRAAGGGDRLVLRGDSRPPRKISNSPPRAARPLRSPPVPEPEGRALR